MLSILARAVLMAAKKKGPISFVGYTANNNGAASTATNVASLPSGVQAGDLLIAVMTSGSGARSWTGDTGWTEVIDDTASSAIRIAWKIATASEPSTYTFTASGVCTSCAHILAFRNAAYDAIGSIGSVAGNGTLTAPAITSAGGFVLMAAMSAEGPTGRTHSTPSGMTPTATMANNQTFESVFYKPVPAGSTGAISLTTAGGAAGTNRAILIGVKQA